MPPRTKRQRILCELDINAQGNVVETSEKRSNPPTAKIRSNSDTASWSESEEDINFAREYSDGDGGDFAPPIKHDAFARSYERVLLRELRALGEPCTTFAQICSHDRDAAEESDSPVSLDTTMRVLPELDVSPFEWLGKSQDFLFDWSKRQGVTSSRVEEASSLRAPERIWKSRTPLLEHLLLSLLQGKPFTLSRRDLKAHVAIGRQNSLDGVYVRLGVGEADGKGFLDGESVLSLVGEVFLPSFLYIGESKHMAFRCTTHDVDRHSRRTLQYKYAKVVKSVVMLPLVLLEPDDDDCNDTELRRVMEGILIAALGAYDRSSAYNMLHTRAGLRRFSIGMKSANSKAGTLERRAPMFPTLSKKVNPTLQPLLQAVFHDFCAMIAVRRKLSMGTTAQDDSIKSDQQSALGDFVEAKHAYLCEKGRLLREGRFVCVAVLEEDGRGKGWAATFVLSNLYSAAVSVPDMQEMSRNGFAASEDSACSHYLMTLQLIETQPSEKDYYANAKPGNYDITKGLQLVARNGTINRALHAYHGGPQHLLTSWEKPQSRSVHLMLFLLRQCVSSVRRLRELEQRSDTWRKRQNDALLNTGEITDQDLAARTLSALQIALLDGLVSLRLPSNGQQSRRRKLIYSCQGRVWQLITLNDAEFVRQNPQCEGRSLAYVRVNLTLSNEGRIVLPERSKEGISSKQLPFGLEVWTRESGWHALNLHFSRGAYLMNELVGLARSLGISTLPAVLEPHSFTSNAGAPQWIHSTRRILSGKRSKNGPSSFYFIFQFRRSREGQAIDARQEYRVPVQRGVLQTIGCSVGDKIHVHLDFWDHADPASYRVLIAKGEGESQGWHVIGLPASLREALSQVRDLFRC